MEDVRVHLEESKLQPQISVIVPVYNVEKYLSRCLESIINQSYKNLEIILIDDGSSDRCPEICDMYAEKDQRIKVLHKRNGGLSVARNTGIEIATGEYVAFVDSDDYIAENMYEVLLDRITCDGADIAICNFLYVNDQGELLVEKNCDFPIINECLETRNAIKKLSESKAWYYVVAWNKLYHKDIFKNLRFPKGKYHEDEFVIHYIIQNCGRISCVRDPLYYYVQREKSIMSESFSLGRMDIADALIDRYYFAKKYKYKELKNSSVVTLSTYLCKWEKYAKNNIKYMKRYKEIQNKSMFLIWERSAWNCFTRKKVICFRLKLMLTLLKERILRVG